MQGHFCFIKCLIFERLLEVDVSAICWIFDEACSCGPYFGLLVIFSGCKLEMMLSPGHCCCVEKGLQRDMVNPSK